MIPSVIDSIKFSRVRRSLWLLKRLKRCFDGIAKVTGGGRATSKSPSGAEFNSYGAVWSWQKDARSQFNLDCPIESSEDGRNIEVDKWGIAGVIVGWDIGTGSGGRISHDSLLSLSESEGTINARPFQSSI
jgi:hypothetical protein